MSKGHLQDTRNADNHTQSVQKGAFTLRVKHQGSYTVAYGTVECSLC